MSGAYIKEARVQGFGCVQDATLKLTRLHALIGPNDSGKTTLMRAIHTLSYQGHRLFYGPNSPLIYSLPTPADTLAASPANIALTIASTLLGGEFCFALAHDARLIEYSIAQDGRKLTRKQGAVAWEGLDALSLADTAALDFFQPIPQWFHLSANSMRHPSGLFSESEPVSMTPDGGRLPAVYDAILNRGDDTFRNISNSCRELFPSVRAIRLKNINNSSKAFEVELLSGVRVGADSLSDGLLYFLAFSALEHVSPASVVLIEEPENGLHPSRIAEVMGVLRRLSERVQIILATHSPFVINELRGDEVTVVTRPPDRGTQTRRLADTPNFEERSKVYALGELWVSYADGKDEHALLSPPDAAE